VKLISDALSQAVKRQSQFDISIAGTGAFPSIRQPKVLWIGITDPDEQLNDLHELVDEECAKKGFEKESRAYRPHLTIARIRRQQSARALAEANEKYGFEPLEMRIEELLLFRSELSSKGARYTVVSRHKLAGQ
jgi:2'-5' RNA ligase